MAIELFPMGNVLSADRAELDEAYHRVMSSGRLILGREVEAFEQEFASYCEADHCVTVGNGHDALAIALRAQGVCRGDEVIVPGHTFIATWLAVSQIGAVPIACDVDPNTYNLDPICVNSLISPRTVAIVPVHLYGNPAPMGEINAIAARHGLFVLEDAAQAHGGRYRSRRVGSLGGAAGFSFYPTKNLGALGDGGAIVTNDDQIASRARKYRNYGATEKDVHEIAGVNSRLDELQAAFLRTKLSRLDKNNSRRRVIAAAYRDRLEGLNGLQLPRAEADGEHVYHLYVVRTPHRDALAAGLEARGICTQVHYPRPPHLQGAFAKLVGLRAPLTVTEALAHEVLSLPMWPGLSEADVCLIANGVREVLSCLQD